MSILNQYKHTGKEFISELGVDSYDFSARFLAPLTGRFDSPDPKAWDYTWLSPYTFCAADPINNSDPTGMDIYRYDKDSGKMLLYQITDDNFDIIGDFKYDKESGSHVLKTDRNGNPKALIDNVEKGILADGINFKHNDNVWETGNPGQPTVEGFQNFVIELSEMLGVELAGYYYSKTGSDDISFLRIGMYNNSKYNESHAGTNTYRFPQLQEGYDINTNWHTHPSTTRTSGRFKPSDKDLRRKYLERNIIKNHIILTKDQEPIHY